MADHRLEIVLAGKDATQKAFRTVTGRIKGLTKSVFNLRNAGLAAAGAAGLGYFVKKNLEAADSIVKTADAVGISTDALQEYRYMADLSGVATSTLETGIGAFSKRLGELKNESGSLYGYLKKNNEALIEQLKATRTTDEAFEIFLSALAGVENQSERTALSAAGLSRTVGIKMTNMVAAGTEGIEEMRREFERLGLHIDRKWLDQSAAAADQFSNLEWVIRTQFMRTAVQAAPKITELTGRMADWISENDDLLTQDLPDTLMKIASGVGTVTDKVGGLVSTIDKKYDRVMGFFSGIADLIPVVDVPEDVWRLARGEEIHKARVPFDDPRQRRQLDEIIVRADALNQMEIKGPRFGKPDDMPGIITPDMISEYENLFRQTRTPLESLYTDLDRINRMWDAGAFGDDKETYYRAIEMYGEKFSDTFDGAKDNADDLFSFMQEGFEGWATQYSSTLNDMLWEADFSFSRIAESFGRMITQMMIQSQMSDLAKGISTWAGSYFASEHGNVFFGGHHVEKYARGGVVNRPTVFPMARGAGLMGEAGPEAVLPLTRVGGDLGVKAQAGTQKVRIEIHNDSGQAMEVTEANTEFDAQGMIVSLWIDAYQRNKGGLRNAIGG